MPISKNFDVIISGGGFAGMWLAVHLATETSWSILVVERSVGRLPVLPELDIPSLALTASTLSSLSALGMNIPSTAIGSIHVSEQGAFGTTVLDSESVSRPAFGGVVEVNQLYSQLREQLSGFHHVSFWANSYITASDWASRQLVEVSRDGHSETVHGRLLVAADGAHSPTRSHLGIEARVEDYGQVALLTNIQLSGVSRYSAYERFTVDGPRALLPLSDRRMALVWVMDQSCVQTALAQSMSDWLVAINEEFGSLLNAYVEGLGQWRVKALTSVVAEMQTAHSAVLVGNAAHTMHPVAGQGFNLTVRDLTLLAEVLCNIDLMNTQALNQSLKRYERLRRPDQVQTHRACDSLIKVFGIDNALCKSARGLGMLFFDHAGPLKDRFALRAMGE